MEQEVWDQRRKHRQRLIDITKNQVEYGNFRKWHRRRKEICAAHCERLLAATDRLKLADLPTTPDPYQKSSRRAFEIRLLAWRRQLREFNGTPSLRDAEVPIGPSPNLEATGPSPTLEATGPSPTLEATGHSGLRKTRSWRKNHFNGLSEYTETRSCRRCGLVGHLANACSILESWSSPDSTPRTMLALQPPHGGNWSEPSYGGNWSELTSGSNWSELTSGGNWSELFYSNCPQHSNPSYGGNWSQHAYGGNWNEPPLAYGGNWSEPTHGRHCLIGLSQPTQATGLSQVDPGPL